MVWYILLLFHLVSTGDNALSSNPGDLNCQVSKDIEDEANSYFQRIYNHPPHPTLSIDEILDLLKKFQDSPIKRERVSPRPSFNCSLPRYYLIVSIFCRRYIAV